MTDDLVFGASNTGSAYYLAQVKMRQLTLNQNEIKKEFTKIVKNEFNKTLSGTTILHMLCKPEYGRFKILPHDPVAAGKKSWAKAKNNPKRKISGSEDDWEPKFGFHFVLIITTTAYV